MIALVKASSVSPARLSAFEILRRVEDGAYASVLLASHELQLNSLDRALCHEIVMGVLRWQLWLDRLIEHFTDDRTTNLDPPIRVILRMGLYQLRFLSRIPNSAAVNESVNLVKRARLRSAMGLVNAVLRRATREPEFDPAEGISDALARLSVSASHPRWLIERWAETHGLLEAEKMARANNEPAPTAFRVIKTRADASEVLEQLTAAGAQLTRSKIADSAWRIKGANNLLPKLVETGQIYIQDEASQLVAQIVDAREGQRILDVCAAPGGKTTQIAAGAPDSRVVAGDLHEHRIRTVASLARLQNLNNIHAVTLDALQPLPLNDARFDRVLVDAPCSGTGTLRRNPEIRWRISPADIEDLAGRQKRILENAASAVRPGGRLIYSTCSVEVDENEAVRESFLENNKSFTPVALNIDPSLLTSSGAARTWPQRDGTDGFFIAAFQRKSD